MEAGETLTLADIQGSGVIRHIWLTPTGAWRSQILRFYWDDSDVPAVECPLGDFFACGWGAYAQVSSLAVCVNPGSAFNSYWEMPFRRRARVTLENRGAEALHRLLPDHLHPRARGGGPRLLPRAVPPRQPPAL